VTKVKDKQTEHHRISNHSRFVETTGKVCLQAEYSSFSALTLLIGQQEGPAKTDWWGTGMVISLERGAKVQMICMWSSWCHCRLIISCSSKIQNGLPFWCQLTQVVLENRPLNQCGSVVMLFLSPNQQCQSATATIYYLW